jgi:hypothetical protein
VNQLESTKDFMMASATSLKTPYDKRVQLVQDTISGNSKVGDKAASELAVQILHALDSIPEKMR